MTIYLDNAATAFPKPGGCLQKAMDIYLDLGASPGRGGYDRAVKAHMKVSEVRNDVRRFFGADSACHVCFSSNATDALNTLIQGMTLEPCHVVSTCLEHNSVLRPLHHLSKQGRITYDLVPFDLNGFVSPDDIRSAIRPDTRFVIMTHVSNVLGTVQHVEDIGLLCQDKGIFFFLDVSQSAGLIPIFMKQWKVSALAFTGHKSLLSPTGIGGLVITPDLPIQPTTYGGTGVNSDNPFQPDELPHRLEAGTVNLFGIIALGETMALVNNTDLDSNHNKLALFQTLKDGISMTDGIEYYGPVTSDRQVPLLSINIKGHNPSDTAAILDGDFDISVRAGLHCAPLAHKLLGTHPHGTVRISLGRYNNMEEITFTLSALRSIAKKA